MGACVAARILIVDDEPAIRDLLARFMAREGYIAIVASNGREALRMIDSAPPDLILLDLHMPELDGFSVCRQLKSDPRTALIPITMLTGMNESDYRRKGLEAGADDFLTKPFDQTLLRARIRSQLHIKQLTDQLERTESVIFMLAMAVELKDPYTQGHLLRLEQFSQQLALELGLSVDEVRWVRYGGILHDIGKIGVPEAILAKPGALTADEYAQMRQHPAFGARLVSPLRFAREVAPIILAHHERWDGTGYPRGLAGEAIPLAARIFAVADVWDALSTDRPYRPAWPPSQVLEHIRAQAGRHFDPRAVEALVAEIAERGAR